MKGAFVVIDGLGGLGKSTQMKKLEINMVKGIYE